MYRPKNKKKLCGDLLRTAVADRRTASVIVRSRPRARGASTKLCTLQGDRVRHGFMQVFLPHKTHKSLPLLGN